MDREMMRAPEADGKDRGHMFLHGLHDIATCECDDCREMRALIADVQASAERLLKDKWLK